MEGVAINQQPTTVIQKGSVLEAIQLLQAQVSWTRKSQERIEKLLSARQPEVENVDCFDLPLKTEGDYNKIIEQLMSHTDRLKMV